MSSKSFFETISSHSYVASITIIARYAVNYITNLFSFYRVFDYRVEVFDSVMLACCDRDLWIVFRQDFSDSFGQCGDVRY